MLVMEMEEKFKDLADDNYRKQDICTVCTVVISSPKSGEHSKKKEQFLIDHSSDLIYSFLPLPLPIPYILQICPSHAEGFNSNGPRKIPIRGPLLLPSSPGSGKQIHSRTQPGTSSFE